MKAITSPSVVLLCCQHHLRHKNAKVIHLSILIPVLSSRLNNMPASAGDSRDMGSTPGLGTSSGEGNGNPFQYSCLKKSMDRGAWRATDHGLQTTTEQLSTHTNSCYWLLPLESFIHFFLEILFFFSISLSTSSLDSFNICLYIK